MSCLLATRGPRVLPGACELLAEIRAAGIRHALVTSSEREIMDAVLAQLGLDFDATVCAADVRRGKPDPEPYRRAAALLGADPRQCVALEDSPNGVAAAEAAGCRVVAVPSLVPITESQGRVVVASLTEVSLPMLRAIAAAG
jgi:HAD superfamily hydrolase (TIGR01509 family)